MEYTFSLPILKAKRYILKWDFERALELITTIEGEYTLEEVPYIQAQILRSEIESMKKRPEHSKEYLDLAESLNYSNNPFLSIEILERRIMMDVYNPDGDSKAHKYLDQMKKIVETPSMQKMPYLKNNYLSKYHFRRGELERTKKNNSKAIDHMLASSKYARISNNEEQLIRSLNMAAHFLGLENRYSEATSLLEEVLDIQRRLDEEGDDETWIMANLGSMYAKLGDLLQAERYYLRVLERLDEDNDNPGYCGFYKNIAELYYNFGDLEKAKNFAKLAIKYFEKYKILDGVLSATLLQAKIQMMQNNYPKAISILDQIFSHSDRYESHPLIVETLFLRILIYTIQLDSPVSLGQNINSYLDEIRKLSKEGKISKRDRIINELSLAVYSYSKNRLRDKLTSLEKLEWILSQQEIHFEYKTYAMRYLMMILLQEYKESHNKDVLDEINSLIRIFYDKSIHEKISPLLVESNIFQSRLYLVQGEYQKANDLLKETAIKTEKLGIKSLINQIQKEQNNIKDEFQRIQAVIDNNYTFSNQLEKEEFDNYLNKILKFKLDKD